MTDEEEEIMEGFKQTILDGQKEIEELAAALAARDRELADARAMWGREYQRALERADTAERALAEARGFLASVLDCVDQSNIERLCRLADTISDWLEGKLAARPAPAECLCGEPLRQGQHHEDCPARADPRPAPACDCGFPWGGGLTAPKRHANDCATRRADPRGEEAMTSSADCDCWFLRLEGRHYEDCNKGHKNPPRAEPPAPRCECGVWFDEAWEEQPKVHTHAPTCPAAEPRCECAPEIEYGVRRHDYDCPVAAAERARADPRPAPRWEVCVGCWADVTTQPHRDFCRYRAEPPAPPCTCELEAGNCKLHPMP